MIEKWKDGRVVLRSNDNFLISVKNGKEVFNWILSGDDFKFMKQQQKAAYIANDFIRSMIEEGVTK